MTDHQAGAGKGLEAWRSMGRRVYTLDEASMAMKERDDTIEAALQREAELPALLAATVESCARRADAGKSVRDFVLAEARAAVEEILAKAREEGAQMQHRHHQRQLGGFIDETRAIAIEETLEEAAKECDRVAALYAETARCAGSSRDVVGGLAARQCAERIRARSDTTKVPG